MRATARDHATSNCCIYLMFANLCHWNEHPMCKVSLSLSLVTDQDQQTTYNSLAADSGKETGLRTKSPSWNDLRCFFMKSGEGPALDGAYLSGCQVFKLPRSGCIPELGITKSLYKHMWWYITFLHARGSNSHCCHTHAGTSFQTQHVHTCPWMLLTIFPTLQFCGSDGVNPALVPLINLLLFFNLFLSLLKRFSERYLVFKNPVVSWLPAKHTNNIKYQIIWHWLGSRLLLRFHQLKRIQFHGICWPKHASKQHHQTVSINNHFPTTMPLLCLVLRGYFSLTYW